MKKSVTVHGLKFMQLIPSRKIEDAISRIAKKINRDFKNQKPLFLAVLNGSFLFAADLLKKIKIECEISFIKVSSYSGTTSTGKVNTLIGVNENLNKRPVIILEDIVDSGNTLEAVTTEIRKHNPDAVSVATLFFKPEAYRKKINLDYVGIKVPNKFLVGYGLDYNGLGRNLDDVYVLEN
jgi:hypoxanthine phosphoribosyltransferase